MTITDFKTSLLTNSGASLNLVTNEFNPNKGYFVSVKGKEIQVPVKELTDKIIHSFITSNYKTLLLSENKNYFLGAWVENDIVYLDVSIKFEDKRTALKAGLIHQQKAIFDANKGEAIFLPEAQKSGTITQILAHITQLVDKLME